MVTCFSTSSAARPGNSVITVTCVSVTSGKASTGRFLNAIRPPPMKMNNPRMTNSGWLSANPMRRLIMRDPRSALCREDLLQQQRALADHFFAWSETLDHAQRAEAGFLDLQFAPQVASIGLVHEGIVAVPYQQDGRGRNAQRPRSGDRCFGGYVHFRAQPAIAVVDRRAHLDRHPRRIREKCDGLDFCVAHYPRPDRRVDV